ncbi:MAG: DUF2085 domain-containing protein [archaeon]|jgi:uncharacterized membrane protein|nr:hypothetical protein [Euryarchaeota archaeon]MDP6703979.1 DUF2085 domain-containing protein [archaeon]MDP7260742.1 DUF2085 domain-containing protein [archaeon]|tara:strand:- start:35073 stop:35588 length:516 start_codon:yes stop_codon:yes gene_type:complete
MKLKKFMCHQRPERSFKFSKYLVVCSRCTGVYLGAFVSTILLLLWFGPFNAISGLLLPLVFMTPMALDGLAQLVLGTESDNTRRFFTGYLAGASLAILFFSALSRVVNPHTAPILSFSASRIIVASIPAFFIIKKFENKSAPWLEFTLNFIVIKSLLGLGLASVYLLISLF